jgi:hypothetical protein
VVFTNVVLLRHSGHPFQFSTPLSDTRDIIPLAGASIVFPASIRSAFRNQRQVGFRESQDKIDKTKMIQCVKEWIPRGRNTTTVTYVPLHLHGLLFGVLGWVSVQHFVTYRGWMSRIGIGVLPYVHQMI